MSSCIEVFLTEGQTNVSRWDKWWYK